MMSRHVCESKAEASIFGLPILSVISEEFYEAIKSRGESGLTAREMFATRKMSNARVRLEAWMAAGHKLIDDRRVVTAWTPVRQPAANIQELRYYVRA